METLFILFLLFCVAPVMIASLPIMAAAQKAWLVGQEKQRRIELHDARLQEARDRADERAQRKADADAIREAKIKEAHNRAELLELKIEAEALKLAKLRKDMGFETPFTPTDYPS